MTGKKDPEEQDAPLDNGEASSAPRPKGGDEDLKLLLAELRQRAQGLSGDDLEFEISRFFDKMIDRHAKVVPEGLRAQHRELLRGMLEEDPTLRAMTDELRRGITKPSA